MTRENHLIFIGDYIFIHGCHSLLVGGFNPSEKYARQIGSFPQVGVNMKKNKTTTQFSYRLVWDSKGTLK